MCLLDGLAGWLGLLITAWDGSSGFRDLASILVSPQCAVCVLGAGEPALVSGVSIEGKSWVRVGGWEEKLQDSLAPSWVPKASIDGSSRL